MPLVDSRPPVPCTTLSIPKDRMNPTPFQKSIVGFKQLWTIGNKSLCGSLKDYQQLEGWMLRTPRRHIMSWLIIPLFTFKIKLLEHEILLFCIRQRLKCCAFVIFLPGSGRFLDQARRRGMDVRVWTDRTHTVALNSWYSMTFVWREAKQQGRQQQQWKDTNDKMSTWGLEIRGTGFDYFVQWCMRAMLIVVSCVRFESFLTWHLKPSRLPQPMDWEKSKLASM